MYKTVHALMEGWQRFWFAPRLPHTLAIIRIATGAMIAYIHAIWLSSASDFFGPHAWIDRDTIKQLHARDFAWSYLWYVDSTGFIVAHEIIAILAGAMVCLGCGTRWIAPLAWFMTLMVCHRMTGMLFGLDQVAMLLAMYLMLAPCGDVYSWDHWWRSRGVGGAPSRAAVQASPWNTIATRLIQLHLCIMYLFGGLGKLRGEAWWDGNALWLAAASYEYQSIDMTWVGHFPILASLLTHITLFWETFYVALIWPRWSRPVMLAIAFAVHAGIALCLGMVTFGSIMIVANLAFIEPVTIKRWVARIALRKSIVNK